MAKTSQRGGLPLGRKILFSLLAVLLVFTVTECVLRLAGFRHPTTVESMAFSFPLDDFNRDQPTPFLERDDVLFWKPRPNVMGHNSKGIFGPEFSDVKDPGRFRIVTLGDSCTHFGPEPYPQRLQALLNSARPGRFEVINAGVIGYTSFQGLQRLTHEVAGWSPDVVTVYFGWNDHWLARGYSDRDQPAQRGFFKQLTRALDHFRLFQGLELLIGRRAASPVRAQNRVSLEDYGRNLREMKRAADSMGASLWLMTAPHALELGVPTELAATGEVGNNVDVVALHDSYNNQVRTVARELGITLVDLEQIVNERNKAALLIDDHIHLSDAGRTVAAQALLSTLANKGLMRD